MGQIRFHKTSELIPTISKRDRLMRNLHLRQEVNKLLRDVEVVLREWRELKREWGIQ